MEDKTDLKRLNIDPAQPVTSDELAERLIRLLVGIALVGQDGLRKQLPIWEAMAVQSLEERDAKTTTQDSASVSGAPDSPETPWFPRAWEHRLVGLAFETPNYLKAGFNRLKTAPQGLWRISAPLRLPLDLLGVSGFTRNWLEGFLERLQADMAKLEEIGENEAQTSRALGEAALSNSLDALLEYLSENEGIQDLVQNQTTGITQEVVGEVRERTVSADTLIEALVRKVLRQPHLPPEEMVLPSSSQKRDQTW